MCGRYTLTSNGEAIAEVFEIAEPVEIEARYNIAPTQVLPTVRARADGRRVLAHARWGLVPPGADSLRVGARMINARSETVHRLPAFRRPFREQRCLVPASGWVEWTAAGRVKDPWLFCRGDGRPLALAGIWQSWADEDGQVVETYAILTREAADWAAHVHDRMPVILDQAGCAQWLAAGAAEAELRGLLAGEGGPPLEIVPISHRINRVQNDDPACLELRPVQTGLF